MAFTAVTYTFSNSTTADATQVNQNYQDIISGLSDGTKDISVNAGTFAGNVSISGNTTIGNASSDTLTVTASLASTIPIGTTNSYDIGSSTLGLRALYFGANSQTVNIKGSASMSATWTLTLPVTAGTDGYYLKTNGSGVTAWQAFTPPTIQAFTSGSGTYTTPSNVKYIRVRMVGAGGGGSANAAANGTVGGNTTFGTSLLVANGGAGGVYNGANGVGGTASLGTGPIGTALSGGAGGSSQTTNSVGAGAGGGHGGASLFGGSGRGGDPNAGAGGAGATNTGAGGGGGGSGGGSPVTSGAGGASGGFVDAIIAAPSASYGYVVGAGGAAGSGGSANGGAGAAGYIEVTEYYS